jgi:uncharacterized protein
MMSTSTGFRVLVADLVKRPGASRAVTLSASLGSFDLTGSHLLDDGAVHFDLHLERILEGLVVRGTVEAEWAGVCGRCLRSVSGRLRIGVDELFETEPIEGETYQLDHDSIDLEALTRDAIGVELPLAPRCRPDCAGLCSQCGADLNDTDCACVVDDSDPRWAALAALEFDPPQVDPLQLDPLQLDPLQLDALQNDPLPNDSGSRPEGHDSVLETPVPEITTD